MSFPPRRARQGDATSAKGRPRATAVRSRAPACPCHRSEAAGRRSNAAPQASRTRCICGESFNGSPDDSADARPKRSSSPANTLRISRASIRCRTKSRSSSCVPRAATRSTKRSRRRSPSGPAATPISSSKRQACSWPTGRLGLRRKRCRQPSADGSGGGAARLRRAPDQAARACATRFGFHVFVRSQ